MANARDSSLLFSLDSLMTLESERVVEQAEAAAARARAAERARDEAARALAERQRREAERERARLQAEEERERAEQARLEGIRQAERERVLAAARAEQEVERRVRESQHELRLAAEQASVRARSSRRALGATALAAVLATSGAVALELFVHEPRLAALEATYTRRLLVAETRTKEVRALLDLSEERVRALERLVREAAEHPPAATPPPKPTVSPAHRAPRPARPAPKPARPCRGDPNDPLNPCL